MSDYGFTIIELSALGPGVPVASIPLQAGLNVISGASDTGKTFLFQALNYMLGGSRPPKRIPEANPYLTLRLSLEDRQGNQYTLERPIRGGNANLYPGLGPSLDTSSPTLLAAQAAAGRTDTISAFLLRLTGFTGRRVKKNIRGETRELSFRDLAHLNTIDEVRIYTEGSPVVGVQYTQKTVEASVFKLLLTGEDDSGLSVLPNRQIQRAGREAVLTVLSEVIGQYEREFSELVPSRADLLVDSVEVSSRLNQINREIAESRGALSESQAQRNDVHRALIRIDSRRMLVLELVERFDLLGRRYQSDIERLEAVSEAGDSFRELPTIECPFCHANAEHQRHEEHQPISDISSSCRVETEKTRVLLADLQSTIAGTRAEEEELRNTSEGLQRELDHLDSHIEEILKPLVQATYQEWEALTEKRARSERAIWLQDQIELLKERRDESPAAAVESPATTSPTLEEALRQVCLELEQTLRDWRFPSVGPVVFDPSTEDFVVGFRARDTFGKGIRALIYSAFSISTLRFCADQRLPHPGFVVLDSPLVAYRAPDDPPEERLGPEVKVAFFENLADSEPDEQVIIFDNEDPPLALRGRLNHIHFSKAIGMGRYGFFPSGS